MQKRVLNKRPDFTTNDHQNVSSNYYPVNSAIAIIDTEKQLQLVVNNDRSQGGSVLKDATIEFMINRRLHHDDGRGVGEDLNEEDSMGLGISVQAMYYVQFFNYTKEKSQQRFTQLFIDEPLQYHFAFNFTVPDTVVDHTQLEW